MIKWESVIGFGLGLALGMGLAPLLGRAWWLGVLGGGVAVVVGFFQTIDTTP